MPRLYIAPVNLAHWNMFEKAKKGHIEDFKAPKSASVGDLVAFYVTKSGSNGKEPGIYGHGRIVKAPYSLKGETRVDVEFERLEDYLLVTSDEVAQFTKCLMRFQAVKEDNGYKLYKLIISR